MTIRRYLNSLDTLNEKGDVKHYNAPDVPANLPRRKSRQIRPGDADIERLKHAVAYFQHHNDVLAPDQVKDIEQAVAALQEIIEINKH